MLVSDFDYDLPSELIAKYPPKERGSTRLLVLNRRTGATTDSFYRNLADFLQPQDVLILNDTRVMHVRLYCVLPNGHPRELVVLEKHGNEPRRVMYRGKLHNGDILTVLSADVRQLDVSNSAAAPSLETSLRTPERITITKILDGGIAEVQATTSLDYLTEQYGNVPLPPYLHRSAVESDRERYQTVWADQSKMGSAAAPTASLNMTTDLLAKLRQKGVLIHTLTLHVGLGTFLPIRTDAVEDHHMHSEWYNIPDDTLQAIAAARADGHRVVAVGTTVARTLEYYAKTGLATGEDDIFIYPGFKFQLVDALLTNFHAPRSTVLMLASAFAGWDHLSAAYAHAVKQKYHFLSYGDSMFIC